MARHKTSERQSIQQETRQALLEAAAEAFAQDGYARANINQISLAAGFAKGTIYNYFPSKRALMLSLIDDIANNHFGFIAGQVRGEVDPSRRLSRFFQAGFDFVSQHLAQSRVMVLTLYGSDEEFKNHMGLAYLPFFRFVGEEIVGLGIEQQQFRQVDPTAMSALLMTVYLGTGSQLNEEGQPWLDPDFVADFCLKALRAPA